MKRVEWTDENGWKRARLVQDDVLQPVDEGVPLEPPDLERLDWDAEGPSLAIAVGARLHAAWWNRSGDTVEVWVSSKTIGAPDADRNSRPALETSTVDSGDTAPTAALPTPTNTTTPEGPPSKVPVPMYAAAPEPNSWVRSVLVGVLPTTMLVGLVGLAWIKRGFKPQIAFKGKAQPDEKAQHTR